MAQKKDTKTGKWYYYGKYTDNDGGVKQYKKRGFETKKECRIAEVNFLEQLKNKDKRTFNNIWNDYAKYIKTRKSNGTILAEKHRYEKHIFPYFSQKVFLDITAQDIINWQNELLIKISPTYVNTLFSLLKNIFNYAEDILDLENTAISKVKRLKEDKNTIAKVWNYEEYKLFYDNIDDYDLKVFFRVLYFTGMRRGEIFGLTWNDYDGEYLSVNKSLSKHGLDELKTKNSYRRIAVDTQTKIILNKYKDYKYKFDGFLETDYIFGGKNPMYLEKPRKYKDKLIKKLNLPNIRIHDFRHSHVSYLISKNIPITAIADRIGDSVEVVMSTYSHMIKENENAILEVLECLD